LVQAQVSRIAPVRTQGAGGVGTMTMTASNPPEDAAAAAADRKRKRLEAWRKRQQEAKEKDSPARSASASPPLPPPEPSKPIAKVKMSLGLGFAGKAKKKKKRKQAEDKGKRKEQTMGVNAPVAFGEEEDDDEEGGDVKRRRMMDLGLNAGLAASATNKNTKGGGAVASVEKKSASGGGRSRRERRWDAGPSLATAATTEAVKLATVKIETQAAAEDPSKEEMDDALDTFMDRLEAGAVGSVAEQWPDNGGVDVVAEKKVTLSIDVAGTMMRGSSGGRALLLSSSTAGGSPGTPNAPVSPAVATGGVITAEELERLHGRSKKKKDEEGDEVGAVKNEYTPSDWESDAAGGKGIGGVSTSASEAETDDEEEEKARRAFIEALRKSAPPVPQHNADNDAHSSGGVGGGEETPQLASEVKSEKLRREELVKRLEAEASAARKSAEMSSAATDFGRLYNDGEGGVMEEAERNLHALTAAPDALEVLAELNKKKELRAVDHSKVDYLPIKKNLYVVPRNLAALTPDVVADRRASMRIRVRGRGAPAPASTFAECGLSERVLLALERQGITEPFPVQAQCLPCVMAGRDVIGIAKTGSGKTLAYLLPMLRHIGDQPPLGPQESGPIGLVLAPARELAFQIHKVCKVFAKLLGMKSTAVYGGAGVADQIGDLKRGTHIAVATPGRMIDILTMQSGKILSLHRVSFVVMDEADRMFDMGFAPQISAILSAVRPDRQTVLFSATFPKAVEALARKSLQFPIEVIVGGRSVASDSVEQHAEVVEEEDKFLRLLQLLGDHAEDGKKVIVFVDTQARADSIFCQLQSCGYISSLSLHGGKEQEDRDSTITDFKRVDGPSILVATSVAGRGLDVPSCSCVINYSCPNHLEDYVHRVGRTGRAGNRGIAHTLVNSGDEAKFAPVIVRALIEAGQSGNIGDSLRALADSFRDRVKKGEARWAGSGFKGKGYSYNSSELNDAQKLARMEKRQALIDAGMIDDEDSSLVPSQKEDSDDRARSADATENDAGVSEKDAGMGAVVKLQARLSADVLALPGMKTAILKKAGMAPDGQDSTADMSDGRTFLKNANHFVAELEINDYPREARWKITQKETTARLQDEFQTAVTLKGEYFAPSRMPSEGERKLYLHLEATGELILQNCIHEIRRLLNEETLRVSTRSLGGGHRYNVL